MKKQDNTFLIAFKAIKSFLEDKTQSMGEKAVMLLILACFEQKDIISQRDVVELNSSNNKTTYGNLKRLKEKGYITTTKQKKYFGLTFIELTEKGRLTASQLRRQLNSGL
jgi:DNA-binding MarR family transcriptional regulator